MVDGKFKLFIGNIYYDFEKIYFSNMLHPHSVKQIQTIENIDKLKTILHDPPLNWWLPWEPKAKEYLKIFVGTIRKNEKNEMIFFNTNLNKFISIKDFEAFLIKMIILGKKELNM